MGPRQSPGRDPACEAPGSTDDFIFKTAYFNADCFFKAKFYSPESNTATKATFFKFKTVEHDRCFPNFP